LGLYWARGGVSKGGGDSKTPMEYWKESKTLRPMKQ